MLPEPEPAVDAKKVKTMRRREEPDTDFFDPQDTGFATVVAQLDEITSTGRPKRRSGRTVN